jgi:hypothetical protein
MLMLVHSLKSKILTVAMPDASFWYFYPSPLNRKELQFGTMSPNTLKIENYTFQEFKRILFRFRIVSV